GAGSCPARLAWRADSDRSLERLPALSAASTRVSAQRPLSASSSVFDTAMPPHTSDRAAQERREPVGERRVLGAGHFRGEGAARATRLRAQELPGPLERGLACLDV